MTTYGRIDVHSHLLPGIDDGCRSVEESVRCARAMVEAGYTHSFVTPHIWPGYENVHVDSIPQFAADLQRALDEAGVPLRLIPGGELNLGRHTLQTPADRVVTYGMGRRHALIDFWCDALPPYFEQAIRWLQSLGLTVVIAHPERVKAIQCQPELADWFIELGVLLQGNLQCLSDPPEAATCRLVERYLLEGRYTFLGSDLHRWETLDVRLNGLRRAIELVGEAKVDELTKTNPRQILLEPLGL
jgi:protein-tyrosine phosphatase